MKMKALAFDKLDHAPVNISLSFITSRSNFIYFSLYVYVLCARNIHFLHTVPLLQSFSITQQHRQLHKYTLIHVTNKMKKKKIKNVYSFSYPLRCRHILIERSASHKTIAMCWIKKFNLDFAQNSLGVRI